MSPVPISASCRAGNSAPKVNCGTGTLVSSTDTTISGTARPTAPTMNSALPVQVSDRIPPAMAAAVTSATSSSTASEKESGRKSAAISAAILISAASRSAMGGICSALTVMRSVRERNLWLRKLGSV